MKKNEKKHVKVRNPLIKRVFKELLGDWRKYLVVSLFLVLTIGFVSGMYVANESMMKAANESVFQYKLEDGHVELKHKADEKLLLAIESGEKADIKQYYLDKAKEELDAAFENKFGYGALHEEVYQKAYSEAWNDIRNKIHEKYIEEKDKYGLDNPDFKAVSTKLYENFYRNEEEDHNNDGVADGTIRVYAKTEDINLACLMEGSLPETQNEIAVDRMHADNVGIKVGDTITISGQSYKIVGLIAYVNYATLHEKNTDLVFDSLKFDVAMVTESGFNRLNKDIHYTYAWQYEKEPIDEKEEKKLSDDFLQILLTHAISSDNEIEEYIPRYANPAINFAKNDIGADKAMGGVLLDILTVIIAFIFAVTISNTITKEAQVIGTLRASGYSKKELIEHYICVPIIVTFISASIGNILGYTVLKNVVVSMYYDNYSLPSYETVWNTSAFFKTTLIPLLLMFVVNLTVIIKMMQYTPLQFLRRDLKKTKRKRAMRLPRWTFLKRFRLRIMLQNIPNYIVLFFGIFFIMIMLAMAVGMPDTLNFYKDNVEDMMFAKYQYVLKSYKDETGNVLHTKNKDAEKFNMKSLQKKSDVLNEEISVYGISDDSKYVKIEDLQALKENEVYISTSFQDKYNLEIGDSIVLNEKYENKQYSFKVAGFYDQSLNITIFMPIKNFCSVFDFDEQEFGGYMSNSEITDIQEEHIATIITKKDITKMCDQLDHSMGSYMEYFEFLCVLLSAALIYLLTKIIIEKNENAISMTKILGYENKEIAGLYLLSTTIILIFANIISVILGTLVMQQAWRAIMSSNSGWFAFVIEPIGYVKMFAFVFVGYLIVLFFDFRRIKKIPMDKALKTVE
ncbi:MAG: FtsX-like permease family protein [Lachnospira sp.]|jgi:putative ABC transport system permease protein|nr:FtsX-like permease family protein [Lachnospira sp.]